MKLARLFPAIALVGLFVTACGGGTGGSPTPSANVPSDLSISSFTADFSYMSKLTNLTASGKGMVGVILPDTTSSTRYVAFDDPYLRKAAQMAGYTVGTNSDPNAVSFAQGYNDAIWGDKTTPLKAGKTNSDGYTLVGDQVATSWDNPTGQTIFQQAFTANPSINATVEANDGLGNAVIN